MKKVSHFSLILFLSLIVWSCSDNSSSTGPEPPTEASAKKQFVWNAMNYWYYWQGEVDELADSFDDDDEDFQGYLNSFSDAEALFEDLQVSEDQFSFFIDDYEEFEDEQDGIFAALGLNYGFIGFQNSNLIVGYIRYVVPGSPADEAGLQRLDLFTKVDGTELNTDNVIGLLTDDSPHELTLADIETNDQGQVSFPKTGTVDIASEEVIEDPIYQTTVMDTSNTKIGYMMYNAFQGNSHEDLNNAFGDFKAAGIDELVLDLRYNGGGAVITSQLLSSLISGLGSSNVFAEFSYNDKRSQEGEIVNFLDEVPLQNKDGEFERDNQGGFVNSAPLNALSLNKLYVLTTSGTASASEALINGLIPYIDVTIIGDKTIGKDEGSLTLFDAPAPYLDDDQANPDHKIAIQPIVLKLVNSDGEDYPNGLEPDGYVPGTAEIPGGCSDSDNDNCLSEITFENLQNQPPIGSPEDPLFARAISLIIGEPMPKRFTGQKPDAMRNTRVLLDRDDVRPLGKEMYIEPFMMPKMSGN